MVCIGVDACKAGWFAVVLQGENDWEVGIFPDISGLWNQYRQARMILIDIPIGLLDGGVHERLCDKEARALLTPPRCSSVFPVPSRPAVYAESNEASQVNYGITGRKLSRQTLSIIPKIKQVDQLLSTDTNARSIIREIHPELCFWALNGGKPMKYSKKKEEGFLERMEVLLSTYPSAKKVVNYALQEYFRREVARDDILDAMAAAVTSSKARQGLLTVPENPEVDSKGLPMEMVYYLLCLS